MRKNVRGEERDTTTHLIEIVFLLTLVVLLNLARVFQNRDRERRSCDLYSLGTKLFPHLLDLKATWRLLGSFKEAKGAFVLLPVRLPHVVLKI